MERAAVETVGTRQGDNFLVRGEDEMLEVPTWEVFVGVDGQRFTYERTFPNVTVAGEFAARIGLRGTVDLDYFVLDRPAYGSPDYDEQDLVDFEQDKIRNGYGW